jgi:hypothetical protein
LSTPRKAFDKGKDVLPSYIQKGNIDPAKTLCWQDLDPTKICLVFLWTSDGYKFHDVANLGGLMLDTNMGHLLHFAPMGWTIIAWHQQNDICCIHTC